MAAKKTAAESENTASAEVSTKNVGSAEKTYSLTALKKHCRKLFGISTAAFAGAVSGIEDKPYTVSEMKSIIEKWCKKEVK
ncbi:MAG: hypothetical protein LUG91_00725 [Ruminococcus sp.]|nr:hypothetical protein [Ruminococcus sp.]MCD7810367.1 hypothetical protein [Ruminococcus sp.]